MRNLFLLHLMLLVTFHAVSGHNMVHKDELNLQLLHMRKSWHLYVKQFAGDCLYKSANSCRHRQKTCSLCFLSLCKMLIKMDSNTAKNQPRLITSITGLINVSVTFARYWGDLYFDKHPFRQWTFTLDKTLRLNLTFSFTKFSSSRIHICSFQNLTVNTSSAEANDVFTFCKKLSQFHVFPQFQFVKIEMFTADHKWNFHYFVYKFTISYCITDLHIVTSVSIANYSLCYPTEPTWILKTESIIIYSMSIAVQKFQSVQIQVFNKIISCVRVFDGPGTDTDLASMKTSGSITIFAASSFQCIIHQRVSNICSPVKVIYHAKDFNISLTFNSSSVYSFNSSNQAVPVLLKFVKIHGFNANISVQHLQIQGRFPHLCEFGGITIFLMNSSHSSKFLEHKTHCKCHTKVFKTKNTYLEESVLVVIFNYPIYRIMSFDLLFSRTICSVTRVKPCQPAVAYGPHLRYFNSAPYKERYEQTWRFTLFQSKCALFEFNYKHNDRREICSLSFYHTNVKSEDLNFQYSTTVFMPGDQTFICVGSEKQDCLVCFSILFSETVLLCFFLDQVMHFKQ